MSNIVDTGMPLVTCIITCYKKFDYLFEAIESALKQNYPRIELLITDDGSENFPQEKVESFVNEKKHENVERVVVHHNDVNVGTVRNINGMLKIAKGEFFINLDGDDVFYDETVFSRIVERFCQLNVDFLACSRMQCDEELNEIKTLPTEEEKSIIRKLNTAKKQFQSFAVFQYYDIASGSAMYYTKSNLERMGLFDEHYRNWQDGPRIAEYAKLGNMIPGAYDIIAVKYRDGGVSNNPKNNIDAFAHISGDRLEYIKNVLIPDVRNRNVRRRRSFVFNYYWETSETQKDRLLLLLCYPEKGVMLLHKKLKNS